jgi:purine-binding chemotaxis protein CheW
MVRVGSRLCALPLEHVAEVMRPLPIESVPDAASFVAGVSLVRGIPTPIVDLSVLLNGERECEPSRLVALRVGERRVGVLVDEVTHVRTLDQLPDAPPLLQEAAAATLSALERLDSELLYVLNTARIVSMATTT